ncbi:unnamed protein product [Sphagnum tenellum]
MWFSCSKTLFSRYGLLFLLLVVLENVAGAQQDERQFLEVCKKLLGVEDPTWKEELDPQAGSNLVPLLRIVRGRYTQGEKVLINATAQAQQVQGVSLTVAKAVPSIFRNNFELSLSVRIGVWQRRRMVYRGVRGKMPPAPSGVDLLLEGDGVYSATTGDLCMLGCAGKGGCKYKLSLKYPLLTTIQHMGVTGELVSLVERTDPFYFDPVSITALAGGPYEYTRNDTVNEVCSHLGADVPEELNLKLWKGEQVCRQPGWTRQPLRVTWNPECVGNDCSPFGSINSTDLKSKEFYMVPGRMRCDGNLVHGEFTLTQNTWIDDPFGDPSILNGHLLTEGVWDPVKGKLCMLGCQYHGSSEDCAIAITVQFPLTLTVTQRATVIGHVTSLRKSTKTDDSYFKTFSFQQFRPWLYGLRSTTVMSEYVYSKIKQAKGLCVPPRNPNARKYPSAGDWHDLELQGLSGPQGLNSFSFSLLTVGSQFRTLGPVHAGNTTDEGDAMVKIGDMLDVSYTVSYPFGELDSRFHLDPQISAEGIYNPATGMLCLIGCRSVDLSINSLTSLEGHKDCQVFFSIQLPPVDAWRSQFSGTVKSLRNPDDPLYFKQESFSGMMFSQTVRTVWRQDLEILISVVMLSLAVIFIFWQLLYSRRYPETLPYISTSMLGLLSLAHMIPLVLNFEALFDKTKTSNAPIQRGWPEINEVVVRLTTMSAMLLQLRLLQKAWQSRLVARESGTLSPLIQEQHVLYVVLPLYLLGGIIAVVVHAITGFKPVEKGFLWRVNQRGWWWDLKAYGGLLLDFHLFPQVVANVLWGAKEQAPLAKAFYFGMAVVRSLPHIYDLCRTFRFVPTYSDMYMYANPEWDFYSAAWDIVIPCGTLLLASLIYMQQRWGGRCILPARWRSFFGYEKVPSVGP